MAPNENQALFVAGYMNNSFRNNQIKEDHIFPSIQLVYRRGIVENVDFGLKVVNFYNFGIDFKYQVTHGITEFSVGGAFAYAKTTSNDSTGDYLSTFYDIKIPFFITYNLSPYVSSTVTPIVMDRVILETNPSGKETKHIIFSGGSYSLKLGKSWGVVAEAGYYKPVLGGKNANDKSAIQEFNFALFWQWNDEVVGQVGEMEDLDILETFPDQEYRFLKTD
jgi:hypothetical protein